MIIPNNYNKIYFADVPIIIPIMDTFRQLDFIALSKEEDF